MSEFSFKKNTNNEKLLSGLIGVHVSKMGYEFDFMSDQWRLDGSNILHLEWLLEQSPEFVLGAKATFSRFAEAYSASTCDGMKSKLKKYIEITGELSISVKGITKFKEHYGKEKEYVLGGLKAFLINWYDWGFPGVDKEAADFLDELILSGQEKGKAVKKRCPYSGPYTELEQAALSEWAVNAFLEGEISLDDFTLFNTLMLSGRRPIQIRSLRVCDLEISETEDGNNYDLNVPRAKQKNKGFRSQFNKISINEDLYLLLKNLIDKSLLRLENKFGIKAPKNLQKNLPIFIAWGRMNECESYAEIESLLDTKPDYLHLTGHRAGAKLWELTRKNRAKSERTNDYIIINARRFRYTKASNLSKRGIRGVALAAALDHSDTQHVGVYTENTSKNAEIIDEVMADALAPLAQAFAGTLIDSERDAIRANDPHSRVKNERSHNVGNCGTYSFCASGYRACYTCVKFQPWRDAPHHEVLNELLKEREDQEKAGVSVNVIQATDRLLLAVQQVIQLCEVAKSELTEGEVANG